MLVGGRTHPAAAAPELRPSTNVSNRGGGRVKTSHKQAWGHEVIPSFMSPKTSERHVAPGGAVANKNQIVAEDYVFAQTVP